jgi:hypothetical protein
MKMTRKDFLQTVAGVAASAYVPVSSAANPTPKSKIKRGVSFYSYQEEFYTHAMTLEDCFAEVASMGAEGVQLIAEEAVPDYPTPPESWVRQWHGLMDKYQTKPTNLDTFVDVTWGGHRQMTLQESVDTLVAQFKLCSRLGFKVMRPTTGPVSQAAPEMIEKALPYAEKYDVRIAPEIHAPIPLKGKYVDSYMDLISRTKTKHLGFTLDMGIFMRRPARVARDRQIRDGLLKENIARLIEKAHEEGTPKEKTHAEVERMGGGQGDIRYLDSVYSSTAMQNPRDLLPIMPYIYNIHGKFYEMTEDLHEYSIPYEEVVPVLIEGGYDRYIDSEYEGQRLTQDAFETDSCEQVRRQHVMLRRLLGEI